MNRVPKCDQKDAEFVYMGLMFTSLPIAQSETQALGQNNSVRQFLKAHDFRRFDIGNHQRQQQQCAVE
jgi:hypothetical protein